MIEHENSVSIILQQFSECACVIKGRPFPRGFYENLIYFSQINIIIRAVILKRKTFYENNENGQRKMLF